MKRLAKEKLVFIDLETTGLSPNEHEIIEVGALVYNPVENEIEKEWTTKIAPTHIETAQESALRINGYVNNPGAYNGKLKSALIKFNSIVKGCMPVGQNISFDLSFLYRNMENLGITPTFSRKSLDLMSLVWFKIKDTDIPGMSLETLCNHFGVCNIGAHSALVDCRRAYEIYRKLENIYKS